MRCPVCKNHEQQETELRADDFKEGITECVICGTVWSINHGVVEIVKDAQVDSFLEAQTECVEGDDYSLGEESG
ncbi:hypothetical protein L4X63_10220 [Geomonas sp. Red32]|uniref:hypothetical protein n=1 Tax=Geomonas sp. Red32 TaxID=2912856 RepID=UPI00202CF21A|nr:hypothetical protein [Geomonas sp. Red32]MCM0081966.1 hypothetical protein [Geomonas sp. Red32]